MAVSNKNHYTANGEVRSVNFTRSCFLSRVVKCLSKPSRKEYWTFSELIEMPSRFSLFATPWRSRRFVLPFLMLDSYLINGTNLFLKLFANHTFPKINTSPKHKSRGIHKLKIPNRNSKDSYTNYRSIPTPQDSQEDLQTPLDHRLKLQGWIPKGTSSENTRTYQFASGHDRRVPSF